MTWFAKAIVAWTLAATLSALAIALVSGLLLPCVIAKLERLRPLPRANLLLAWCIAPVALAVVLAALSFAPTLLTMLGLTHDHCGHGSIVPHLCAPAPQGDSLSAVWQLGAALLLAGAFVIIAARALTALRVQRTISRLFRIARRDRQHGIWIIDQGPATVFSAGIGRVHTFVARSLLDSLSAEARAVVLAHERSHRERRDPFRFALAYVGAAFHLPSVRRRLLASLRLACEQAADDAAAQAVGNRLAVADTIIAVEKLSGGHPQQFAPQRFAMGMACTDVIRRVEALLVPHTTSGPVAALSGATLLPIALLASATMLHLAIEQLLGLLIR
jgi:beta-lactamase regulating signal transducer with metallopeptidase domain